MILRKEYGFESAHFIHNHPGKCRNLHGHSYKLMVSLEGPVNPETGMIIDFDDLTKIVDERVISRLDHRFLNDLIPLSTAENIAVWIWGELKSALPELVQVEVFETSDNCVIYRGA
ncbi:MAG: 6-carboxytetrahydropterin synthase QueD [Acidobacteria bacterium]|nr:6-carboxytetrahydropterin synthase QueD [Acidobacteriota bacterium]